MVRFTDRKEKVAFFQLWVDYMQGAEIQMDNAAAGYDVGDLWGSDSSLPDLPAIECIQNSSASAPVLCAIRPASFKASDKWDGLNNTTLFALNKRINQRSQLIDMVADPFHIPALQVDLASFSCH